MFVHNWQFFVEAEASFEKTPLVFGHAHGLIAVNQDGMMQYLWYLGGKTHRRRQRRRSDKIRRR